MEWVFPFKKSENFAREPLRSAGEAAEGFDHPAPSSFDKTAISHSPYQAHLIQAFNHATA
jgi:hypothetical protein